MIYFSTLKEHKKKIDFVQIGGCVRFFQNSLEGGIGLQFVRSGLVEVVGGGRLPPKLRELSAGVQSSRVLNLQ